MKIARAEELIAQFPTKSILVIGDIMLDRYIYGTVDRLNPEAPVPVLHARDEQEMTGGAGNVAKNVSTLTAKATLVSVIGSDSIATRVLEASDREKYELRTLNDPTRPTTQKIRYVVGSQQLLRVDYEETHDISAKSEQLLLSLVDKEIAHADGIIISDYAKGVITHTVATGIIARAQEKGIPVGADVKPSRAGFLGGVTFISPNEREAHEMLGINWHQQRIDPATLAAQICDKLHTDVYVTLGSSGVYVCTQEGNATYVAQTYQPEVFDPSGAGDAAMVMLMLSRLCGADPTESAELANAAAAMVVTKLGSVGTTPTEVLQTLALKNRQ